MITMVNTFTLTVDDGTDFERTFAEVAEHMRSQPGFVRFHLMHSLNNPACYVNVAEWADREAHDRVVGEPSFFEHIMALAKFATPDPQLYSTVLEAGPVPIGAHA
jgi:heme-degrading monooxygenase HmoA